MMLYQNDHGIFMRNLFMIVALWWGGPALAGEKVLRQHSVQAGIGNQYGWAGGAYLFRLDETWSAGAGYGMYGYAAHGRISPISGYRPFYVQIGYSPILVSENDLDMTYIWYGPDISVGLDTKYKAFSFTTGVGYGHGSVTVLGTTISDSAVTFAIGIGVNFGKVD